MQLTIDTEACGLSVADREKPLYSREAFELVSREGVRIGWGVCDYMQSVSAAPNNPRAAAGEFPAPSLEFEMRQPERPFSQSDLRSNITCRPGGWLWRRAA
jgi:hypothetical protein